MIANAWPAIFGFLLGTVGALYLVRKGLALRTKGDSSTRDDAGRLVMSWRAYVIVAVALWLFLFVAESVLFVGVYCRAPP